MAGLSAEDLVKFDIQPHMEEVMSGQFEALGRVMTLNDVVRETVASGEFEPRPGFIGDPISYRPLWADDLKSMASLELTQDEYGHDLIVPERIFLIFDRAMAGPGIFQSLQLYSRTASFNSVTDLSINCGESGPERAIKGISVGIGREIKVAELRNHRARVARIAGHFLNRLPGQNLQ